MFLAAKEGSLETAKILLDHYANREITDHMDRLPRDAAAERMHRDILQLLDEYRISSPADMALTNGLPTSPNGYPPFMHPPKSKNKQRKKNNGQINMKDILSYPNGTKPNGLPQKKKQKRKSAGVQRNGHSQNKDGSVGTLSPGDSIESPNGYDMAPPTYDNVCGQGQLILHPSQLSGLDDRVPCALQNVDEHRVMSNHYNKGDLRLDPNMEMIASELLFSRQQQQQQQQHQQQQLSQSPMSVTNSIPTPPSSYPSNSSPLSNDGKVSPLKGKTGFPTSPPHYLAMQNHAQRNRPQKSPHHYHIDNYPFNENNPSMDTNIPQYTAIYDNQQRVSTPMQAPHIPQYPTPPSQHSYIGSDSTPPTATGLHLPDNILTPSPDSPGHWSSSSPHSAHSDWSEGISSPVPPIGHGHVNKGRNQMPNEAVYI